MPERIIIIDDEIDMLMLLKMILEDSTEYVVETTNNPSEGLKLLIEKKFDLVITDLKMPGLDGMELYSEINKIHPDVPVIIITAYGSQDVADEAIQKGVTDFITKPFKKQRILFSIKKAFEITKLRKENLELKGKL